MTNLCEECGGDQLLCPEPHYWVCTKCERVVGLCERCGSDVVLCAADWPWHEDYWICTKCDSTYTKEQEIEEDG